MRIRNRNIRGSTALMSALLAGALLVIGMYYFTRGAAKLRDQTKDLRDSTVAEAYVTELLELFSAMTSTELLKYLTVNPVNAAFVPYRLCSHINVLDRASGVVVNADPIAALPANTPLHNPVSALYAPNRFYSVQVVNMDTLQVDELRCRRNPREFFNMPGPPAVPAVDFLQESPGTGVRERLLVTVGVSWVPVGDLPTQPRRMVMSAVLPRHSIKF